MRVMGRKVELQQVVLNLVMNAIEAMADMAPVRELSIRLEPQTLNGVAAVGVAVRDTGVGLPVDGADALFEAFYTTKAGGLGLGLSISRSIVEAHGGVLRATRNDGDGATFAFILPAAREVAA
jgi:C4-dicarboxylate-specific signal transduction histidine kinase